MRELYSDSIMPSMPRLISMIDRDELSPTFGCCDRLYWHCKTTDFANARFQEAALTLALVYKNSYPGNIYKGNEKVRAWILAALDYWSGMQHRDGSFDEAYPNEHSFVATAFSSYAVSEACIMLKISRGRVIRSLERAGDWLIKHNETQALNQVCGSIAALYNIYLLTKDRRFLEGAERKIAFLRKSQDEEGWLHEYGGPDFGYLSLAIDYLAKYYRRSGDREALDIASKAIRFFRYFVHPNGTVGGEYGSRNTEYLIPSGFEFFSGRVPEAGEIAYRFLEGLKGGNVVSPPVLDDRYFVYNGCTFLQAYDDYSRKRKPAPQRFEKHFPNAGLLAISRPDYYCVVGLRKGGVFRIYTGDYAYSDSGFIGVLKGGERVSSQWLDRDYRVGRFGVSGNLHKIRHFMPSPGKMAVSRVALALGRKGAGRLLKNRLRKIMIMKSPRVGIRFERSFEFGKNIIIRDRVKGRGLKSLKIAGKFSTIHVASSRYFQPQELGFKGGSGDLSGKLNKNGTVVIVRKFSKNNVMVWAVKER